MEARMRKARLPVQILLAVLVISAFTPAVAQTLTGPNGSYSIAFWYLGKDGSNNNITSCCYGLTNLYWASSKLYLSAVYTNPSFTSSASDAWFVDMSTRTDAGGGMVYYLIKAKSEPTAGTEYVRFTDGGNTSNWVGVFVNKPTRVISDAIQQWTSCSALFGQNYSGWTEVIYDGVYDRSDWVLSPIDTYEYLENFTQLYAGENWPTINWYQMAFWPASQRDTNDQNWSTSTNRFPDHYAACSAGDWTPAPVAYQTANPQVSVQSFTQKFFVGSTDKNFDAVCGLRQAVTFETDRGTDGNISSPPSSGYCSQGSYAN